MRDDEPAIEFETYDERPIAETEAALERLLLRGEIVGEPATADDLARARVPASAGPVFLSLARRFRAVTLAVAEVRIALHDGDEAADALGGWRLLAEPPELDLRLGAPDAGELIADIVYDATWSPRGSGAVVRHSTVVHFLVRAAAGDDW